MHKLINSVYVLANLGFKKRKWEIFCRLFSIFLKTSIGSCRKSDNHHLGRLLIKSGYTLDMKHGSWITLSAYILKTKCRNLATFFFFLSLWKSSSFLNFWVFIWFFGKMMPIKKKGWIHEISYPCLNNLHVDGFCLTCNFIQVMWSLLTLSYQTFVSFSSISSVEFE